MQTGLRLVFIKNAHGLNLNFSWPTLLCEAPGEYADDPLTPASPAEFCLYS